MKLIDIINEGPRDLSVIKDISKLSNAIDLLDVAIKNNKGEHDDTTEDSTFNIVKNGMKKLGVKKYLETIFDPKINGIKAVPLSRLDNAGMGDVEAWTNEPVYLINEVYRDSLKKLLGN